jgi:protein-L-isoaspartate O-methyltransferase
MSDEKTMGLRQQVKKGITTLDDAIKIAKNYNESIQKWLKRRKDAGIVFVPEGAGPKGKKAKAKKVKKNAVV